MHSPHLGNDKVSRNCQAWHSRFNDALASRDLAAYLSFFHDNCSLQVNNAMPIHSRQAIEPSYRAYLTSFQSMTYEFMNIIGDDQRSSCEALYTFTCHDGSTEVVQCTYFVDLDDAGLISSVRIYGNGARVFKPFMRAND
ncbi:MAG: nuclear transport factor 2 family protein [Hyphomonadaceae bacterium]